MFQQVIRYIKFYFYFLLCINTTFLVRKKNTQNRLVFIDKYKSILIEFYHKKQLLIDYMLIKILSTTSI